MPLIDSMYKNLKRVYFPVFKEISISKWRLLDFQKNDECSQRMRLSADSSSVRQTKFFKLLTIGKSRTIELARKCANRQCASHI